VIEELSIVAGAPRWDDRAADELVAAVNAAARLLDEQWGLFDRGWWELLTTWTGPARASYNEHLLALRDPVDDLRAALRAGPGRITAARPT
jgi:hypothetical protein